MPLDDQLKKDELKNLIMTDETINFNCQSQIKHDLDLKTGTATRLHPIELYDPQRVTELPLALTQVIEINDMDAALELLDRNVLPDFSSREAALRSGNLALIERVFNANSGWKTDPKSNYLTAAIESGDADVLGFSLSKLWGSSPDADAVGEITSLDMVDAFLDYLVKTKDPLTDMYIRSMVSTALKNGKFWMINYLEERFPKKVPTLAGFSKKPWIWL
jgi:hypothetical protein